MTKTLYTLLISLCFFGVVQAQDAATLMAEGVRYEQQLKDTQAVAKYALAFQMQPSNAKAALKAAEMNISIGSRQTNDVEKKKYYSEAKNFTDAALKLDSNNADANYMTAVVFGKMTEVETSNDKTIEQVRNIKEYADRALAINPNHGKAWFIEGKWHYEMLNLSTFKKVAIKVMYKGMPKSNIDSAISDFEKCKTLEPYFAMNHLALGKAYYYNKQYEKALASLQQCVKCPTMSIGDKAVKEEAKQLIVRWQ